VEKFETKGNQSPTETSKERRQRKPRYGWIRWPGRRDLFQFTVRVGVSRFFEGRKTGSL